MSQHSEVVAASPEEIRVADTVTRWLTHLKDERNVLSIGTIPGFGEANLSQAAEGVLQALHEGWIYFEVTQPGFKIPFAAAKKEQLPVRGGLYTELIEIPALALSVRRDADVKLLVRDGNYALAEIFRLHMEIPFERAFGNHIVLSRIGPRDVRNPLSLVGWIRFPAANKA